MGIFSFNFGTIFLILLGLAGWYLFSHRNKNKRRPDPENAERRINTEGYLYKMSRVTGNSEYDIFFKSAEKWPVSENMVEKDFGDYLQKGHIPHYVNDFVRENKHHLDELRMPHW